MEEEKIYVHRVWQLSNSTGFESMDNHHKKFIEVINSLVDILNEKRNNIEILDIFHKLLYYSEMYFIDEEMLYQKRNYSDLTKHKQQHRDFVLDINKFRDEYQTKDLTVSVRMMKYLDVWYKQHILGEDIRAVK